MRKRKRQGLWDMVGVQTAVRNHDFLTMRATTHRFVSVMIQLTWTTRRCMKTKSVGSCCLKQPRSRQKRFTRPHRSIAKHYQHGRTVGFISIDSGRQEVLFLSRKARRLLRNNGSVKKERYSIERNSEPSATRWERAMVNRSPVRGSHKCLAVFHDSAIGEEELTHNWPYLLKLHTIPKTFLSSVDENDEDMCAAQ